MPDIRAGWSLVRVRGAGVNRSELRTRQGHSPGVRFPRVLDLVGADTVLESLRLVRRGGTVRVAGSLSGWLIRDLEPIAMIPTGTALTAFHSRHLEGAAGRPVLQRIVDEVAAGVHRPVIDRVFGLDEIVAAHRYMENDEAVGKVVILP